MDLRVKEGRGQKPGGLKEWGNSGQAVLYERRIK